MLLKLADRMFYASRTDKWADCITSFAHPLALSLDKRWFFALTMSGDQLPRFEGQSHASVGNHSLMIKCKPTERFKFVRLPVSRVPKVTRDFSS